jgi:hypothetical protein
MRIISKIKKNYPDIKDLLKNNDSNNLDNIISTTFNGSNLYILSNNTTECDDIYSHNNPY